MYLTICNFSVTAFRLSFGNKAKQRFKLSIYILLTHVWNSLEMKKISQYNYYFHLANKHDINSLSFEYKFLLKQYHNVFDNCKFSFDFSPSGTALRKIEQIKDYLLRHGTCKCGLPCPLRPDYFFEFNPQVSLFFSITCKFFEWLIEKSSFIENAKTALDYHHLSFAHSILILRITNETGTPFIKLNSV